jgi:hypothetical protein
MKRNSLFIALAALVLVSCGSGKQFTSRDAAVSKVKSYAVLPVQVSFTGNLPKNVTPVMLDSMVQQQGLTFQRALHANLLRYNGDKGKIPGVDLQSAERTNALLQKNHISQRELNTTDPGELAKLLQVDAVVKMNVTSNRMMSDLASLGLGALRDVLFWGTNTSPLITGSISNKTADVYADCALLKEGKTLWTAQYDKGTDWNTSVNDVIQTITKKMGKGFPY